VSGRAFLDVVGFSVAVVETPRLRADLATASWGADLPLPPAFLIPELASAAAERRVTVVVLTV